jgi:hypothetical protein
MIYFRLQQSYRRDDHKARLHMTAMQAVKSGTPLIFDADEINFGQ